MKMILGVPCALFLLACASSAPTPAEAPPSGASPPGTAAADGAAGSPSAPAAPSGASEKCDHLAQACHDHAGHSALTGECHTIGHGGDAAQCEARHDECMAACAEAAKSGAHPAGHGSHH